MLTEVEFGGEIHAVRSCQKLSEQTHAIRPGFPWAKFYDEYVFFGGGGGVSFLGFLWIFVDTRFEGETQNK